MLIEAFVTAALMSATATWDRVAPQSRPGEAMQHQDRRGGRYGRPDRADRPGRGGEITVFRDANFGGASTRFDSEMPNLANTGFNDAISSIRLRGSWELCTDAYFRGDCRVFNEDSWNLQQQRLNDHVSSIRPVRR